MWINSMSPAGLFTNKQSMDRQSDSMFIIIMNSLIPKIMLYVHCYF